MHTKQQEATTQSGVVRIHNNWKPMVLTVIAVMAFVGAMSWRASNLLRDLSDDSESLRRDVNSLEVKIDEINKRVFEDGYSKTFAVMLALREAMENPGHRVPNPDNPNEVIVVELLQGGS